MGSEPCVVRENPRAINEEIEKATKALDFCEIQRVYWEQEECIIIQPIFLPAVIEKFLLPELNQLRRFVHQNYIPKHKKGGNVSYFVMKEKAPAFMALYRNPVFLDFLSRLVQAPVMVCPENDPHACALYFFTEPGDHIGFHYDIPYYKGARYTVLVGLVQNSDNCRLVCELYKAAPHRETLTLDTPTPPVPGIHQREIAESPHVY
ncbi:MAG TPA: 2OG-Fe(II) oxygenase [Nitrospiria bacterium]|jgi:hypothetical protein